MNDEIFQGEIVDDGARGRRPYRELNRAEQQARLKEYLLIAPHLLKLVFRLLRDDRVPARSKAIVLMVAGYILSPVDIIPDFVVGVGQLDDLFLLAFALDQIINRVPGHVVEEHWGGTEDVLDVVREILDIASGFMPSWIRKYLSRR